MTTPVELSPAPLARAVFDSNSRRWLASAVVVCAGGALLISHALFVMLGGTHAYLVGTVLLLATTVAAVFVWPRSLQQIEPARLHLVPAVLALCVGIGLLAWVASDLLRQVFAGPLDSGRGDMLVIMEHAIKRLLEGGNPYTVHHVPWDAPLTYGPLLWMPHVPSYLLGFDFRILTLVDQLFIPAFCVVSASVRLGQGHVVRGAALFLIGAGIALHPGLRSFHQIGHIQVYWPLLAIFCVLLRQSRWTAASVCLGLLVSARTPLLSLVPVFFLYLHVQGQLTLSRVTAFGTAVLLPYLPFLVVDPAAVKNGMFDTYVRVMKNYVWQSTRWAVEAYGVTGRLLEHGKPQYVESAQLLCLGVTYAGAWRFLAKGRRVEPWLALALLVFAMTTLWSVLYLYYDVWLLLACALVAYDGSWIGSPLRSAWRSIALSLAIATATVLGVAAVSPGSSFTIDVGSPQFAGYTGGGFGADASELDEGRTVVWIEGTTARIRLPRAGWNGGTLRIAIRPNDPPPPTRQFVAVALNGHALGAAPLDGGWQEMTFHPKRADWVYGFNVLDLRFGYAGPRAPAATETKAYAAAIDYVTVE